MKWSPQQDRARSAVARWMRDPSADQTFYLAGYAGSGKCLGIGTPVLMHDGTIKPVEQIDVNDLVMGPDSKPRRVLGLTRGRSQLYRVVPVKGDPWVCNEDHIMTLVGSKTRFYVGKTIDISVRELLSKWPTQPDAIWKLWRTGVDFPTATQAIDPYWLGLWLGDGTSDNTNITTMDPEVIAYCEETAPRYGLSCKVREIPDNKAVTVSLVGERGKVGCNPLRNETKRCLDDQGRKTIPREYLIADRAQRLAILAGIVDTDGYITNGCIDLITVSEPLRDGILFLARSLGFAAYSNECTKRIKSLGFSGQYHRISMSGDLSELPCRVPHKKPPPRRQIKRTNVTGFQLESIGPGDYYGFELDGDGRFLLGDFTVTHNSTLAQDLVSDRWLFAAYTGKAAHVLRKKGCTNASTIHSLIYKPAGEASKELIAQLEKELAAPNTPAERRSAIVQQILDLRKDSGPRFTLWETGPLSDDKIEGIVVDECSMVDGKLGRDLEWFDKKILVLGDPAQLPPVKGGGYFTSREPDVMLTEVHRHARESGVLRLATHIREGRSLSSFDPAPDAELISYRSTNQEDRSRIALAADQVLVGLNKTRHDLNHRYRQLRARTQPLPYAGDRLVCLRNDRDLGLFNGSQWVVESAKHPDTTDGLATKELASEFTVRADDDSGRVVPCEAWLHHFFTPSRGEELKLLGQGVRDRAEFDWGYALTVHKAQGSEWPRVLVVNESASFRGGDAKRWLYTAVTRSQNHVTVLT